MIEIWILDHRLRPKQNQTLNTGRNARFFLWTMKLQRRILFTSSIGLFLLSQQSCAFSPSLADKALTFSPRIVSTGNSHCTCPGSNQRSSFAETTALLLRNQDETTSSLRTFSSPMDRPFLAIVDFLSLLLFAAIGKASHAADGSIDFYAVLVTALPFVMSWFVTSPLTDVYSKSDSKDELVKGNFQKAAKGWAVAVPLGCVIRGVIKGYIPPIPFVIVTMISTLVIIGSARVVYSVVEDFFVELIN